MSNCGCTGTYSNLPNTLYTFRSTSSYDCGCNQSLPCYDCSGSACPIQLDATCVFYHKFNNSVTALTNLNVSNGATLDLILTIIDGWIAQLKIQTADLPYLRQFYVSNTLLQFVVAVDTELQALKTAIEDLDPAATTVPGFLGNLSSDPGAAINGQYWYNTSSNLLKIKVNGVVKVITTA